MDVHQFSMTQNDITAGKLTDITHWENYIEMWQNINFLNTLRIA